MTRLECVNALATSLLTVLALTTSTARASWMTYTPDTDFGYGNFGTGGDATAAIDLIDNFGGDLTDFASFTAGNIAVIKRGGGIDFSAKVYNAQLAGAVAAIILDAPPTGNLSMGAGANAGLVAIPAVRISQTLGDALRTELESPHLPIVFHVHVVFGPSGVLDYELERFVSDTSAVPEPGSMTLAGIALVILGGAAWRKRFA